MVVCPVHYVHNKKDLPAYQGEEDSSHDNTLPALLKVQYKESSFLKFSKLILFRAYSTRNFKLAAESYVNLPILMFQL